MTKATGKQTIGSFKNDNLLESLGSIPTSVGQQTVGELSHIGADVVTSLFGGTPKTGSLEPNQVIEFGAAVQEQPKETVISPHVEAYQRPDVTELELQTKQQIEMIRQELAELAKALKNLHTEVQTAISQEPVDPGIYHINFYEQLRSFMVVLRQQIEDSRSWLAAFNTRKKKMGYWGMFKKHGTTFGLSNERALATSAG